MYPSPSLLSKNQLAQEGPDSVAPVVIPTLAPTLDRSLKSDRSLFQVRALRSSLERASDLGQNKEVVLLCQLTCQSADIMSSLCGVGVRVRVRVNNFSSKTTRPRDVLFFLKDTLSIEDEKLFKACKSVCSSVC